VLITEGGLSPADLSLDPGLPPRWTNTTGGVVRLEGTGFAGADGPNRLFLPLVLKGGDQGPDAGPPGDEPAALPSGWSSGDIPPGGVYHRAFSQTGTHTYTLSSPAGLFDAVTGTLRVAHPAELPPARSERVGLQALPGPTLPISPTGVISDPTPAYSWEAAAGATWYRLLVEERATGLLFPRFGNSDTLGFSVSLPFFWAMARNADTTFFFDGYTKVGPAIGAELNWLPTGKGRVRGSGTSMW